MSRIMDDLVEAASLFAQTSDGRGGDRYLTFTETVQASQAISLKRIADALEKGSVAEQIRAVLTDPINSYGEGIGDAIQGQLVRGQRGVSQYEGRS